VTPQVSVYRSLLPDADFKNSTSNNIFFLEFVHPRHPDDHIHYQAAKYIHGAL
jgi:hypothetical protein